MKARRAARPTAPRPPATKRSGGRSPTGKSLSAPPAARNPPTRRAGVEKLPTRRLVVTHRRRAARGRAPSVETGASGPGRRRGRIEVGWDGVGRFATDQVVRTAASAARQHGGRTDLALSVVFVTDRALARMHARHCDDPTPTDVITFDLSDEIEGPLGELYVSAERARSVGRARGVKPRRELLLYVVHGVLHLCGFDDRSRADRVLMREAETRVLRALGYADDPSPHDA